MSHIDAGRILLIATGTLPILCYFSLQKIVIYQYDNKSSDTGLIHVLKDHVADHHAESEVIAERVLLGVHDGRAVEDHLATVLVVPLQGHRKTASDMFDKTDGMFRCSNDAFLYPMSRKCWIIG